MSDYTSYFEPFLEKFTSQKRGGKSTRKFKWKIRQFYRNQDHNIKVYEELFYGKKSKEEDDQIYIRKVVVIITVVSFWTNIVLLGGKSAAAIISRSLAIISAAIDSVMDVISSGFIWWIVYKMAKENKFKYPKGRARLEPIAIVVLSVVMSAAAIQMIRESIQRIVDLANTGGPGPVVNLTAIIIICVCIGVKFVLYLVCRWIHVPTAQALALDHRNDVLSNAVALAGSYLGYKVWSFADPIAAVLISLYIIGSWIKTAKDQIKVLTGYTARPELLRKVTWLAITHHPLVKAINTLSAYHYGNNFVVELTVKLPKNLTFQAAQDIANNLKKRIESLPEVERAFVHMTYDHTTPEDETDYY